MFICLFFFSYIVCVCVTYTNITHVIMIDFQLAITTPRKILISYGITPASYAIFYSFYLSLSLTHTHTQYVCV